MFNGLLIGKAEHSPTFWRESVYGGGVPKKKPREYCVQILAALLKCFQN